MTSLEQRKKRKNMSKSFVNSGVVEEKKPQQRRFSGDFDQPTLHKSKSVKKMGQKILPNGFEQKVIVKEFEIEKGGVELIDLIQLYQSAVEYYDSIGDRSNSQLYTEKMQFVFMKPHISKMFQPKKTVEPKKTNTESSKQASKD